VNGTIEGSGVWRGEASADVLKPPYIYIYIYNYIPYIFSTVSILNVSSGECEELISINSRKLLKSKIHFRNTFA
jgi:hypothetical protein